MKPLIAFALCFVAIATLTACGDDDQRTAPLAIEERLLVAADLPDYALAREFVCDDVTGVIDEGLGTTTIQAPSAAVQEIVSRAGFKAGSARVFETGAQDPKDRVVIIALEFDSEQGAKDVLAFSADDSELPCLDSCAFQVTVVSVDVPGARAVQRIATAKSIAATNDQQLKRPLEIHRIVFADGPFFYFVEAVSAPDPGASETTEALVSNLYQRVKGASAR